ncbi:MAG: signal peptidase II [Bdellovibrionales bacterium]
MNFYKYFLTSLVASFVVAIDQATKIYIHTQVKMGNPIEVIAGFFNINYVRNPGGAFGLFSESSVFIRYTLFLLFPLICIYIIFMMLKDTKNKLQIVSLSFILGGAFGNYIDRIRFGYVIDFIDWYVKDLHWPTFNLADSFIVIGVSILSVFFLFEKNPPSKQ